MPIFYRDGICTFCWNVFHFFSPDPIRRSRAICSFSNHGVIAVLKWLPGVLTIRELRIPGVLDTGDSQLAWDTRESWITGVWDIGDFQISSVLDTGKSPITSVADTGDLCTISEKCQYRHCWAVIGNVREQNFDPVYSFIPLIYE